jgi:hypothetical protein
MPMKASGDAATQRFASFQVMGARLFGLPVKIPEHVSAVSIDFDRNLKLTLGVAHDCIHLAGEDRALASTSCILH